MSSTYAEKVIPCWSNTLKGMSKTTTNRKQERGQPCSTPCAVLKTTSSAPRRNVDPRSITRETMRSSRSGVPSLSRASQIRSLGGLSKAWYTSKARMASVGPIFLKSSRKICVAWAVETTCLPPNSLWCSLGDVRGYNCEYIHRINSL